ncbi:MAG: GNAT family N-acetyltransferase [Caldilineaceae bacterium]|nr:GNAT family N-acetyltransferase [Caldilineaceae bacterium]
MNTLLIETERLLMRPFQESDWPAVAAYTALPTIMEYMGEGVQSAEQTQAFVRRHVTGEAVTAYPLLLKAENKLIGHLVFHPWFAPRTYEIGWVLHPTYHRRGYVSEAALALLRYGFETLQLHRIIATCQPENPASYGVMEKIGMRREGHFHQCIYRGEAQWWDEYFYAILAQEWFQLPHQLGK